MHLADKETPIREMVNDYTFGGKNLTDSYERERQGAFESNQAQADHTRLQLSATLEKAEADVMEAAIQHDRAGKDAFGSQWLAERQRLMENAKLASAHCAKEN